MNSDRNSIIAGTGAALPGKVLTNSDLEKMVNTSDEWIVARTGIRERRVLEEGFSNVDLSEKAAREALNRAGIKPEQVDLILVATVTPDHQTPSTACLLQSRLGVPGSGAMDISAGCTGFIYALTVAHQFILSGSCRNVLVVGVEVLTRITDWQDRGTCVLFGDAAGAVVLQATGEKRGVINFSLKADGRGARLLYVPAGGSAMPASAETVARGLHYLKMNGSEVFKFAVRVVEDLLFDLINREKMKPADLNHIFLHQANLRIIDHIRKRLKLPPEIFPVNIDRLGNTSSATIPVAIHEELVAGRLKKGDVLAMVAFGAGLTWGGVLMRW